MRYRAKMLVIASLAAAGGGLNAGLHAQQNVMTFFITSAGPGKGADLGGLAGADAHCQQLATAAGSTGKTWRAYLSQSAVGGAPAVNARDRIGKGPWQNAKGVVVAKDVEDLHKDPNINKETALNEKGDPTKTRDEGTNEHDILTGSQADGTAFAAGDKDMTCANWTTSGEGSAMVGHHDRRGGGSAPTSWNSAHPTRGCGMDALRSSGGAGLFYCFATN